jgi:hypothetical protein
MLSNLLTAPPTRHCSGGNSRLRKTAGHFHRQARNCHKSGPPIFFANRFAWRHRLAASLGARRSKHRRRQASIFSGESSGTVSPNSFPRRIQYFTVRPLTPYSAEYSATVLLNLTCRRVEVMAQMLREILRTAWSSRDMRRRSVVSGRSSLPSAWASLATIFHFLSICLSLIISVCLLCYCCDSQALDFLGRNFLHV